MAGIYVHIPFCASRCIYCGFYSTVALALRQQYVGAVLREWQLRRSEFFATNNESGCTASSPPLTIYLGGGTPSQLTMPQLAQLLEALPTREATEVTIECNPDDVTAELAAALPRLGINRVSMGAQTFSDARLRFLHRRHSAAQVPTAVGRLRNAGIGNISVDLMYGFPGETLGDWQHDIDAALALGAEHLSAYCLTVEEGTPLHRFIRKNGQPAMPDEETERQMYELLIDRLTAAGYEHYEISNFALPGRRAQHNSGYWRGLPYVGLGAASHSYAPTPGSGSCATNAALAKAIRKWNVSDIRQYIAAISRGEIPCECEVLDDNTHYNDRVTVALRTCEGLNLDTLSGRHRRHCLREARRFLDGGLLRLADGHRLVLTRQGLFVSDMVMSSLMLV